LIRGKTSRAAPSAIGRAVALIRQIWRDGIQYLGLDLCLQWLVDRSRVAELPTNDNWVGLSEIQQSPTNASVHVEMEQFQTVAKVGEIPEGEGRSYPLDGTMVAVFHIDGQYTAINDTCPHMGASLASGYVEGTAVTCPWHAWRFSVKDGRWLDNPRSKIANACYAVRVVGDEIQVEIPAVSQPGFKPSS
jgi:nitrite reductase (NADH) small subunit